jgi:hypothetical protein
MVSMLMWSDTGKTCDEIGKFSARDAQAYPQYEDYIDRLARFIEPLLLETPPNLASRGPGEWQKLAGLGWRLSRMSAKELAGHLRILTQSVKDFLISFDAFRAGPSIARPLAAFTCAARARIPAEE